MLDIKKILNNKKEYSELLLRKGFNALDSIEELEEKYKIYYNFLQKEEESRQNLNQLTKEIKVISQDKSLDLNLKKEKINNIKNQAAKISNTSNEFSKNKKEIWDEIVEKLSYFPNIPFDDVVVGKDEKENRIISTHLDEYKRIGKEFKSHYDLIEEKKLISPDESRIISGARHVIFNEKLSKLIKALEKFMLSNNEESGYEIKEVPVIVNKEMLYNTSQLPKFEEDLYKISDNQYLIPTAEVPLTNFVAGKILSEKDLPIKLTASTSCFRSEAGSAGKDTRGLIRLHQFRKVEIVKIGDPNNFKEDFDEMVKTSMRILEKLKIPFRVLELCTGDMSFGSRRTYDLEVWLPGTQEYREISSISIMGDFQSRRMNTRFIREDKTKEVPFTYNGSALAIERTLAAIIENYANDKDEIEIPEVLRKYLDFEKI